MTTSADLFIGLISGTSADGVDAGLFEISSTPNACQATLIHQIVTPYPDSIRDSVLSLSQPGDKEIDHMGTVDNQLGELFAQATHSLLSESGIAPERIRAIGSLGQTVRHRPDQPNAFTLQLTDPNVIASRTGITTVADFRRKDMAAGGQGAPLATAFHQAVFHSASQKRAALNIGGISNISVLENDTSQTIGYDTGPGNVLMDGWSQKHINKHYDHDGQWARSGKVHTALLKKLLSHPYLSKPFPKSTGREDFHLPYLEATLQGHADIAAEDVQTTLAEFTALTIAEETLRHQREALFLCGGGANNTYLKERIQHHLPDVSVRTTEAIGIHADWVEAGLCAWLAKQRLDKLPGNIPSVTGASRPTIMGAVYIP